MIVIRETDDWMALYIDGKLVEQNHSISLRDGLDLLGITYGHQWEDPKTDYDDMQDWFFTEEIEEPKIS